MRTARTLHAATATLAALSTLAALCILPACTIEQHMTPPTSARATCTISQQDWGTVDGQPVHLWTLRNSQGMEAQITDYGTIVVSLKVPDAKGQFADVVLGRPTVQDYVDRTQYFGCTAGRCANRIAKGQFTIDGESFTVATNNGVNHLHGGVKGFDKVMWSGTGAVTRAGATLTLTYTSSDSDEGYPGEVKATVTYTLTPDNHFDVDMTATTNAPTVVNLAHHSYWNLAGQGSGDILGHTLMIPAARYTPVDATLITTGEIASVEGTPLDFRTAKPIGQDIGGYPASTDDPGGYDHNLVLDRRPAFDGLWLSAVLTDPASGRTMGIWSNQPGIQFYSGNFLDGVPGKDGTTYNKLGALCLETQAFPDSINKQGVQGWPDVILRPGETYQHRMSHRFGS
ncbi:MAG: galactose mutarotase [Planctomycetota bacterium]|nr:galactose mutarotase [Planctomycetota bacterium]MDA1106149.1 galactose mutarotase [Planctomycetota bacterium]